MSPLIILLLPPSFAVDRLFIFCVRPIQTRPPLSYKRIDDMTEEGQKEKAAQRERAE